MTKKSEKPEKITVGNGTTTAYLTDRKKVEISVFNQWDHLSKADALTLGKGLIEMAKYEPPRWVPGPGELFRVSEGGFIYLRLAVNRPDCPEGYFNDVGLSAPCLGEPGKTSADPCGCLTPATWADVQEANEDDE